MDIGQTPEGGAHARIRPLPAAQSTRNTAMAAIKKRFHEQLRETREQAQQSVEVMAILLSLEKEEYQALENGVKFPDNETLKRLCMIMEWNYYDTRRLIANEMAAPQSEEPAGALLSPPAMDALQRLPLESAGIGGAKRFDTLGSRLKAVRTETGQAVDIIAMLLNIDPDDYRRMEAGEHPNDELLRRISIIYDWNYYDLLTLLRAEQAKELQPRQMGNPFPGSAPHTPRLKSLLSEMEDLFAGLPAKDQEMILSQLELVRDTMQRMQKAS